MQADDAAHRVHVLVIVLAQVDHAVVAERRIGPAGLGIQREHVIAACHIQDAFVGAVGPIADAQARPAARSGALALVIGVHPQHLAGRAVQAHHVAPVAGGDIDAALHNQRRGLIVGVQARAQRIGAEAPDHFQLVEVGGVDLVQRRIAGAGKIVGIMKPVRVGGFLRLGPGWKVRREHPRHGR
jgi:hypothetical protein